MNEKKIFISYTPWQTRIAITRDGKLQNVYFDSATSIPLERSYFKGIVIKILPGIQTAFVEFGQEKAGFLHISEIDRDLALRKMTKGSDDDEFDEVDSPSEEEKREARKERTQAQDLDIRKILREKEPILVQVNKEPIGTKGAKLSTCYTLPGRFIVLMPNIPRIGISKKIEDSEERKRLRDLVRSLLPEGMGAIIRTTSERQGEREISQDVQYLVNEWASIQKKFQESEPCSRLHEDLDLCRQIIRDHLDSSVSLILCDDKTTFDRMYTFVKNMSPDDAFKVRLYQDREPMFEAQHIESQMNQALASKVHLKSGGTIVIEATEAMTVIDVNTGRYVGSGSTMEEAIFKTNMEAAEEIVRQLRLRNIGGLIVIDFIDMSTSANQQKLFKNFERMLRERDKFQSVVLKISEFGLVQMTRKRSGKTLMNQIMSTCESCCGLGMVNSLSTEVYAILNYLNTEIVKYQGAHVIITLNTSALEYISAIEYNAILHLEKKCNGKITLVANASYPLHSISISLASQS